MADLKVEISSVRLRGRELLRDIEFECKSGTVTVLLGDNGAGKSVLLRSIAGLQDGAYGRVVMAAAEIRLAGRKLQPGQSAWPALTLVLQTGGLWPTLTVVEHLRLPARLSGRGSELDQDLVEVFGLNAIMDRYPTNLSGGERQRVALARAFSLRPEVVLLDEPTAALDVSYASKLMTYLNVFVRDGGCLIMSTHSAGIARALADRCLFLAHGTLVSSGSLSSMLESKQPDFLRFWDVMSGL